MAEWVAVTISALVLLAAVVSALVRVSVAVAGNTQAVKVLTDYLDKQAIRNDCQDDKLGDHEKRITVIETVHKIEGAA